MKWTKVRCGLIQRLSLFFLATSRRISHVMLKMIIDDSAFLFNQRELWFSTST